MPWKIRDAECIEILSELRRLASTFRVSFELLGLKEYMLILVAAISIEDLWKALPKGHNID